MVESSTQGAVAETGADLANLERLDPKPWVALSCPTQGLETDERTLVLLDTDRDGHVRIPEVLHARVAVPPVSVQP